MQIDSCIVCDFVRPELGGKLVILGFFGICPNVDVVLQHLDQPTALTFLLGGGPGDGDTTVTFEVLDELENRVVASTPDLQFHADPKTRSSLAPTLLLVFGHPGTFVIRFSVDHIERFRTSFRVSRATAAIA
ncbi:MAG: SH2 domain-containing protein [Gemmatimonadaceae bacterium]